jgi:hypothetical protein
MSTIVGLLLIAIAVFAFARWRARGSRPLERGLNSSETKKPPASRALYYVAVVPLATAMLIAGFEIPRWMTVQNRVAAGGVRVIEGTVERSQTWLKTGSNRSPSTRMYAIQVGGRRFEWSEGSGELLEELVQANGGGVLRVGKRVRVHYVDLVQRNELVAIHAENLCRLYSKCSIFSLFGWHWERKQ